ncbi:MAG TPA: ADP-ribose pyrophosphatase [Elusimicrobia bacterium]|nr:ADP-ribose pyrophosphatase [Elusimicrobiota bacterium]
MLQKRLSGSDTGLIEKQYRKVYAYRGNAVALRVDEVSLPNGRKATREFLEHPGAVAVLPVLDDGRLIFVRQYRYPVGRVTLEIPAGKLHPLKDSPLKRARAELKEETGCTAKTIKPLLDFWPTPAFSNELLRIYLASGIKHGRARPDEDEFLKMEILSFKKAWAMLERGGIRDSKTIIALQAYKIQSQVTSHKLPINRQKKRGF